MKNISYIHGTQNLISDTKSFQYFFVQNTYRIEKQVHFLTSVL